MRSRDARPGRRLADRRVFVVIAAAATIVLVVGSPTPRAPHAKDQGIGLESATPSGGRAATDEEGAPAAPPPADVGAMRRDSAATFADELDRADVVDGAFAELELPGDIRGPRPRRSNRSERK